MKAKAMVVVEPNRLEMQTFEVLPPAPDQVLVKTTVTSVCSTDLKVLHGQAAMARYPVIMGHEFVGEVMDIGSEAASAYDLKIGDHVTPEPYIPCGRCSWCRTDYQYHNCPDVKIYGLSTACYQAPYLFGGYSEYVYLLAGSLLHKLAPGTPDLAGSLSSVVGNGVRWIKTLGQMSFGQSLVISGAGSQGLCALAAAKQAGVEPVIMLGLSRDRARFELAWEMGVDDVVAVDVEDPLTTVPQRIGTQPDVVVETSGVPSAIRTAFKLVRPSGRVVLIGLSGNQETPVAFDDLVWRDITVAAGKGQAGNVGDAMKLINSGKYPFEKINNFHYKLEDLDKALEHTANPPEGFIKAAVVFD